MLSLPPETRQQTFMERRMTRPLGHAIRLLAKAAMRIKRSQNHVHILHGGRYKLQSQGRKAQAPHKMEQQLDELPLDAARSLLPKPFEFLNFSRDGSRMVGAFGSGSGLLARKEMRLDGEGKEKRKWNLMKRCHPCRTRTRNHRR